MPIIRCAFSNGGEILEVEVPPEMAMRVRIALAYPQLKIEWWDKLPLARKRQVEKDLEWFYQQMTESKLNKK